MSKPSKQSFGFPKPSQPLWDAVHERTTWAIVFLKAHPKQAAGVLAGCLGVILAVVVLFSPAEDTENTGEEINWADFEGLQSADEAETVAGTDSEEILLPGEGTTPAEPVTGTQFNGLSDHPGLKFPDVPEVTATTPVPQLNIMPAGINPGVGISPGGQFTTGSFPNTLNGVQSASFQQPMTINPGPPPVQQYRPDKPPTGPVWLTGRIEAGGTSPVQSSGIQSAGFVPNAVPQQVPQQVFPQQQVPQLNAPRLTVPQPSPGLLAPQPVPQTPSGNQLLIVPQ